MGAVGGYRTHFYAFLCQQVFVVLFGVAQIFPLPSRRRSNQTNSSGGVKLFPDRERPFRFEPQEKH